jgi:monovalent cation:H+ antiporter-2, CPA2 family
MSHPGVMADLGIALAAALVGGLLARWAKVPVLVGYLLAGIVVGPHTPGIFAKPEPVRHVAELGVALLMFAVGVHFSMKELLEVWRTAVFGGMVQISLTILLGVTVGRFIGLDGFAGIFLGCALALSSTAVMMKLLEERGELGTSHGRVMLGILVIQDFSLVAMAVLLPAMDMLLKGSEGALPAVGSAVLRALLFILVTIVLAVRVVPPLLNRVVRTGSRELFLLTVVCLCLLAAIAANYAGLGVELGAFIAGLVISETEHSLEALSQVRPLRDVFASIFFVSVGMMLDPMFVAANWSQIAVIVIAIIVGKPVISALAVFALGWHGRTAILVGLGLAQIGEFSFVLATMGAARGLVRPDLANLVVSCAMVSLLLAPFIYRSGEPLYNALNRTSLSRVMNRQRSLDKALVEADPSSGHVLVLGFGRIGRYVTKELTEAGFRVLVIEYDALAIEEAQRFEVPALYGDASSETVLEKAHPQEARLAVVTLPDASDTVNVLRTLRRLAPEIAMVVRTHRQSDVASLKEMGADVVVHPEREAGVKMVQESTRILHKVGNPIDVWQRAL